MKARPLRCRPTGFTLIELLVVMAIVAVLATGIMAGISTAKRKANSAAASRNLKQLATAIQQYALENRRYPEAMDDDESSGGGAWSWQIREYLNIDTKDNDVPDDWPSELLLAPRHGKEGISVLSGDDRRNLHHFAASLVVMPEVAGGGTGGGNSNQPSPVVRPADVTEPAGTILLGDAPLKRENDAASGCEHAWQGLRPESMQGNPDEPVDENLIESEADFWLGDKAQFLFVDGHVEALEPEEVKRRYFQLDPLENVPTGK